MRPKTLLPLIVSIFILQFSQAQNYLRVEDPDGWNVGDWDAAVFDAVGRQVADLGKPVSKSGTLEWQWSIGEEVKAGIYFCKISNAYGEMTGKVVVL